MAQAKITHQWTDGQVTVMEAGGDLESPAAAIAAVLLLWRECVEGAQAEDPS
jgi:hypothetical protein